VPKVTALDVGRKPLKPKAIALARVTPQERTLERQEGSGRGNPERIHARDKPLKGQTLNAAAGRNKPAKPVVEQAVEGVRNAEGGASERADPSRGNSAKDPGAGTGADTGNTIDRSREEGAEPHGRRSKAERARSKDGSPGWRGEQAIGRVRWRGWKARRRMTLDPTRSRNGNEATARPIRND
jgi:hypothetical protein